MPHSTKDKLYMTATEWRQVGGFKGASTNPASKPLPFSCCSLTFSPFETPVMTVVEGEASPTASSSSSSSSSAVPTFAFVFDLLSIVPVVRRTGTHPITGRPLALDGLVRLTFAKNADGKYMCPVTHKVFNENSRIVAIRTSGNVFAWEAVESLNVQARHWKDLLTDAPFTRADIVWIQDPTNPAWVKAHDIKAFQHVSRAGVAGAGAGAGGAGAEGGGAAQAVNSGGGLIRLNDSSRRVLAEMEKSAAATAGEKRGRPLDAGDDDEAGAGAGAGASSSSSSSASHVTSMGVKTTAAYSGGFTSTGMSASTKNVAAPVTEADRRQKRWARVRALKKKAFVRVATSKGDLNLELHADLVPQTVENFLLLAKRGYYDGTVFHRSIRNFMVQGGDPTGTGRGGECAWGGKGFPDEFDQRLSHSERGVVSMANSGPGTNGSQFFVTYKSCAHLDRKHSVFGRVVGGMDVLKAIEAVPTGKDDRPTQTITITSVQVFADPFAEVDASAHEVEAAEAAKREAAARPFAPGSVYSHAAPAPAQAQAQVQAQARGAAAPSAGGVAVGSSAAAARAAGPSLMDLLASVGSSGGGAGGGGGGKGAGAAAGAAQAAPIVVGKYIGQGGSGAAGAAAATATAAAAPGLDRAEAIRLLEAGLAGHPGAGESSGAPAAKRRAGAGDGFGSFASW
jgi:peptidyl-prolyl cis-trans isomerase-like 2